MKIITLPRRGGKTHAMLKWMREDENRAMMCFSAHEADRLRRENPDVQPDRFLSPSTSSRLLGQKMEIGFDNLDLWLSGYFGRPISIATVDSDLTPRP